MERGERRCVVGEGRYREGLEDEVLFAVLTGPYY